MPKDEDRVQSPKAAEAQARNAERGAARGEAGNRGGREAAQAKKVFLYDAGDGSPAREVTVVSKDRGTRDVATGEELTVQADSLSRVDEDEAEDGADTIGGVTG